MLDLVALRPPLHLNFIVANFATKLYSFLMDRKIHQKCTPLLNFTQFLADFYVLLETLKDQTP